MELEEIQRNWDQFGREDPLWAILAFPDRKNNQWNVNEFFETGRQEIEGLLKRLSDLGIRFPRIRCLDFGCGVGRLTQALCGYFDRCDGVDIAESMIERANQFNQLDRCTYHLNTAGDLRLFGDATFDLVYTAAVLQHIEPRYSLTYIAEFVRVLTARGVAVFEAPFSYTPLSQLPDGAHNATIELVSGLPTVMEPGASARLTVRVTNVGDARWPCLGTPYPIQLGNHWLTGNGSTVVTRDDGRAAMPGPLKPGDEGVFNLQVRAPEKSGLYIIELDMVEEGVSWFADRGSQPVRAVVKVARSGKPIAALRDRIRRRQLPPRDLPDTTAGPAAPGTANQPVMEMHCLSRQDVLAAVEAAAGKVVHVDEYDAIGDGFLNCRYFVRRTADP